MKTKIALVIVAFAFFSCLTEKRQETGKKPIVGTWKLLSGTLIENGDTTITDYTRDVSFIKIINDTHFSFLQHDLKKGKDSAAVFVSGGGRYSLTKDSYTEHLEYCSAREWEGNDFTFTITLKGDTLVQNGSEVVEAAGVNRVNIEKYLRVRE
ncbi:MAG TPA: hypothetical protein VGD90_08355 [Sphingobacteriaceae bacterium]